MKKNIRLTESDLMRLVKRVIKESSTLPHPVKIKMWNEMIGNVNGDGVETIEYIPNNKLVIDAFGNIYTITRTIKK